MPVHLVWLTGQCLDRMKEEFLSVIHCFAFDCSDFLMFLPIYAKNKTQTKSLSVKQDCFLTGRRVVIVEGRVQLENPSRA